MAEIISKEREKQILLAARNIFARYGFSKTTMEDISVEMSMGKASLYYYFPTKESLFEAVITQERDEFMNKIEFILTKHNTSSDKLRAYVEERMKFFQELMNIGMLSYHSFLEGKSVHHKLSEDFGSKEMKVIERVIGEGIASGEFAPGTKANELSILLIHLLQGLRLRAIKTIPGLLIDNKLYEKLHDEMVLTIDVLLKAIIKK